MRRFLIPLAVLALLPAACGDGDSGDPAPKVDFSSADPDAVAVIEDWSAALTDGDLERAASYFEIPSVAENGAVIRIESAEDAVRFNDALPCGAKLIEASTSGEFTTATFELSERPGGACGPGTGGTAKTSFVIEDGKIVEWRRVGLTPPDDSGSTV